MTERSRNSLPKGQDSESVCRIGLDGIVRKSPDGKNMLTVDEALARLLENIFPVNGTETVSLLQANGRVLAENRYSDVAVPNTDNSAMDGYAFRFSDVTGPETVLLIRQRIPAGHPGGGLGPGEAARIFTGAPLPDGADTVMRQEWCLVEGNRLKFERLPVKGESVRQAGEDVEKGDMVLSAGTRLQAGHIGIAASVGLTHLPVVRKPKVALMSTGDELVLPGESLLPGKIYNSNRYTLRTLLEDFGCEVSDFGIVPDDFQMTCSMLVDAAAGHDLILTSGGVSVGEEDHVRAAIEAEGKVHFWRIAVKPGKPLVYGEIGCPSGIRRNVAIIGLPGNPVSIYVTFLLFVRPCILRMQGVFDVMPKTVRVRAASSHDRADERNEFLRARLNERGEAELFDNQGSGVLSSVVWGDGLIDNPPGRTINVGDWVKFIPFAGFFRS